MMNKEGLRPGGRSARVQQSVHQAVRALLEEQPREALTVPQIAHRAGVTPSTIYRRWGELSALLADVSLARLQPDTDPVDTGSLRGDLQAWAEQYIDELNTDPGRAMIRDCVVSGRSSQCAVILRDQLQVLVDRALARQEHAPEADRLLDGVAAPAVYRVMFAQSPPTAAQIRQWVDASLA